MPKHTVTLIPGDGIGVETSAAMQRVVAASGADIGTLSSRPASPASKGSSMELSPIINIR